MQNIPSLASVLKSHVLIISLDRVVELVPCDVNDLGSGAESIVQGDW